jgi:hypothetical protein
MLISVRDLGWLRVGDMMVMQWRPRVLEALQSLLDAGARTAELRDDLDAEDVWPLLGFLWQEPLPERRATRLIAVVLDGLSARPNESD